MTFPVCSDRVPRLHPSRRHRFARRAAATLVAALLAPGQAFAADPFVVRDIRVEGVQRTEAGTIFSYLPIKVGERVDDEKLAQAVKALYATGFFRDVRLEAQGEVLIVTVQERPTISSLTFVGNKEFDTDTIKKALKDIGIADARIFDRSALERAEQELKRQYVTRGLYGATVQTTVTPQDRNRVALNFSITEGDPSKIARINIVGNKAFTEKTLLSEMNLTTPGWFTWYTKNDQYSKQKLQGRPRDDPQLLPEPRLPGVRDRLHAGVDLARQAEHLHHGQRHRRSALHGGRRAHRRRSRRPGAGARRADPHQARRDVLARAAAGFGQGHQRSSRRRRLRIRERERRTRARPRLRPPRASRFSSTRAGAPMCARSTSPAIRRRATK